MIFAIQTLEPASNPAILFARLSLEAALAILLRANLVARERAAVGAQKVNSRKARIYCQRISQILDCLRRGLFERQPRLGAADECGSVPRALEVRIRKIAELLCRLREVAQRRRVIAKPGKSFGPIGVQPGEFRTQRHAGLKTAHGTCEIFHLELTAAEVVPRPEVVRIARRRVLQERNRRTEAFVRHVLLRRKNDLLG